LQSAATNLTTGYSAAALVEAARASGEVPASLEVRRLQTRGETGAARNTSIVMTIPTELTAQAATLARTNRQVLPTIS
jgi:hypothetical protein